MYLTNSQHRDFILDFRTSYARIGLTVLLNVCSTIVNHAYLLDTTQTCQKQIETVLKCRGQFDGKQWEISVSFHSCLFSIYSPFSFPNVSARFNTCTVASFPLSAPISSSFAEISPSRSTILARQLPLESKRTSVCSRGRT